MNKQEFEQQIETYAKEAHDVLCIGETGHDFKKDYGTINEQFRYYRLSKVTKNLVGVDIIKEHVTLMKDAGFQYEYCDIENAIYCAGLVKKYGQFKLIIMIDVIEHLHNTGLALSNIQNILLANNGILIITTPNPFYFRNLQSAITKGYVPAFADHTAWIQPEHMHRLCDNVKLVLNKTTYCCFHSLSGWKDKVMKLMGSWRPVLLDHVVYEIRKERK